MGGKTRAGCASTLNMEPDGAKMNPWGDFQGTEKENENIIFFEKIKSRSNKIDGLRTAKQKMHKKCQKWFWLG